MQFTISTLAMAMLVLRAQAGTLSTLQTDTTLDLFNSGGCSNYQITAIVSDEHGPNGGCWAISASSAKVTSLYSSCTVTVYTDSSCSSGATAARTNSCVTGAWRSFSVDGCP